MIDAALDLAGDDLKIIGLFGGEPLLPKNRPALEYIISKAPDKEYIITTNGYYLEEFLDVLTKVNVMNIAVTLDGEEATHDSRRYLANGKPTYGKIMSGIMKCLENSIHTTIRMNLDKSNFVECNGLKERLLEEYARYGGLLNFDVSPMLETASPEKNEMFLELYNFDIGCNPEERKQRNRLLSSFSPIVNTLLSNKKLMPKYAFCYAHDNGYWVDPYGNIYPCILTVGMEELAIGKYYPNVEFYENSIRNRNIDKIPECRECKYSLLCGGGCPLPLIDYSDVFKPVCHAIKNEIHNLLPMLYAAEKKVKAYDTTTHE